MDKKCKHILISYANENMKYSLKQWELQARNIPLFDEVIAYTHKDLPDTILNHPLMKYQRGGGYWVWKPFLIWKTLQDYPEGTKVFYMDAGCSVYPGEEWETFFSELDNYDTLLFQYDSFIPSWEKHFGQGHSSICYWTKKYTLDFFDNYLGKKDFHNYNKVEGGYVFIKGRNNQFVKEWLTLTLDYPQLIIDPDEKEKNNQYAFFCGFHRHDQTIVTPLAYKYTNTKTVKVLPDVFDENPVSVVIRSSRNHITKSMYIKYWIKFHLRKILGDKAYELLKKYRTL